MSSYYQKLKDPRWQRKRLEMLSAAEFTCQSCFDSSSTLHVHHTRYIKGRDPWEYEDRELWVLCEDCHSSLHEAREMLDRALSAIHPCFHDLVAIASLVAGFQTEQAGFLTDEQAELLGLIGKSWGDPMMFEIGKQAKKTACKIRLEKHKAAEGDVDG